MAIKKTQKRPLEKSQSLQTQNGPASKQSQKPVKKIKLEKPVHEPAQSNGVQGNKAVKDKKQKSAFEQPKKVKREIPAAALEEKIAAKRLKNVEKLKKKNENRKEARREQGQYKPEQVLLSPEALEIRIKEIQSRPEITKTAKRRLAVLKKKLHIAQGTFVPKPKPVADGPKLSKSKRRQLRKKNEVEKRKAQEGYAVSDSKVTAKTQAVEKSNKKEAAAVKNQAIKEEKSVKVAGKKPQLVKAAKGAKNFVVKKEEPEDSEDEDDEEEEEEEGSDDEADDSKGSILNTTEEQTDEDDDEEEDGDEDDDEEEEEEEEEAKVSVKKIKQEVQKKQPVQKEIKKETAQNGDSGKKKRFVLFVGNLPYDASAEDIKKHFLTKVSAVTSVRVPTKQGTNTPRGFAYVELDNATDYEKGLSLQNTILNGRKLNVEYSQSGSKSAGSRPDVVSKNKKLHAMRKQGMLAGSQRDGHKRNDRRQKQRQHGPA